MSDESLSVSDFSHNGNCQIQSKHGIGLIEVPNCAANGFIVHKNTNFFGWPLLGVHIALEMNRVKDIFEKIFELGMLYGAEFCPDHDGRVGFSIWTL